MKRLRWLSLALSISLILLPTASYAHVLSTNDGVGAVLHIEPDDAPRTGSPSPYVFTFKDVAGVFRLSGCDCITTISQNSKTIYSSPLTAISENVSRDSYTFMTPGAYTIHVEGRPKEGQTFERFSLSYLIRVESGGSGFNHLRIPPLLWTGLALTLGLVVLGMYSREHNANQRKKRSSKP